MSLRPLSVWGALSAPYLLLLILLFTLVSWLQFPALPSNDDALFLSRGVGHFSILEFSPHFPGYAGLILIVKLVRGLFPTDYLALHVVVLTMTAMIPLVVYGILRTLHVSRPIAVIASALLYLQPLLTAVALSGLSDGPGLLFWLLVVLSLLKEKIRLAALLSGVMLTIRPSYLLLLLPVYVYLLKYRAAKFKHIVIVTMLPLLLALLYMLAQDGWALFEEAVRFVKGHFLLWGNTSLADESLEHPERVSWWLAASAYLGGGWQLLLLLLVLLPGCGLLWVKIRASRSLIASFVSMLLWTLLFQNPDNLRHLLPLLVLGTVLITLMVGLVWQRSGALGVSLMLMVSVGTLLSMAQLTPHPPANHQALQWLQTQPTNGRYGNTLITNEGVELSKVYQSKRRVADAWYQQQSQWLWLNGAWRFSFTPRPLLGEPVKVFSSRFAGEHGTYVYRLPSVDRTD